MPGITPRPGALLQPCHPVPGVYTEFPEANAYLVDDFGNAVHIFGDDNLRDQWINHIVGYMDWGH